MPPAVEFATFHAISEDQDLERLCFLAEFGRFTRDGTCMVMDVEASFASDDKLKYHLERSLDLRTTQNFEILLVANDWQCGSLTIYDGNHRAAAHFLQHWTFEGVPIFIGVHRNILRWGMIPSKARAGGPR